MRMWRCKYARLPLQLGLPRHFYKEKLPEAARKLLTNKQKAVFEVGK